MALRLYLAGPDVFFRDPLAIANAKKKLCSEYGFVGVFPLDNQLDLKNLSPQDAGYAIADANEALMRSCDGIIANMTPFRGPGMDGGTAYEMGFMRALGKPVFGYTLAPRDGLDFTTRSVTFAQRGLTVGPDGEKRDADGLLIEDFGLADNLMMAAAVAASGTAICTGHDLSAFEDCLRHAQAWNWGSVEQKSLPR